MSRRALFVLLAIAASTAILSGAAQAVRTTAIGCGTPVFHSTVLGEDVTGCTGAGLVIAAAGVTLNLAGHTVSGDGSGGGNGIDDAGGFGNLTIQNGTITGFESGIAVTSGSKVKVVGVTSHDNLSKGIVTDGTLGVTVQSSYTSHNTDAGIDVVENAASAVNISGGGSYGDGVGIEVTGGPATINANVLASEGDTAIVVTGDGYKMTNNRVISAAGGGIVGQGAGMVSGNTVTRAGTFGIITSGGQITKNTVGVSTNAGIYVTGGSVKTTISDNAITSSSDSGIDMASAGAGSLIQNNVIGSAYGAPGIHDAADGVTIKGNSIGVVVNGGTGIAVQASNVTIANNKVGAAGSDGISITGTNETISGNTVGSTGGGEGFFINAGSSKITSNTVLHAGDHGMYIAAVDGDLIQGNLLEGGHDGLRLDPGGHNHTVKSNTFRGNSEIGLHDQGATGSVLTGNIAIDNYNGIETPGGPGTDGGHNKAAGNVSIQCSGVVCTAP